MEETKGVWGGAKGGAGSIDGVFGPVGVLSGRSTTEVEELVGTGDFVLGVEGDALGDATEFSL
jgi:hypothetical protein